MFISNSYSNLWTELISYLQPTGDQGFQPFSTVFPVCNSEANRSWHSWDLNQHPLGMWRLRQRLSLLSHEATPFKDISQWCCGGEIHSSGSLCLIIPLLLLKLLFPIECTEPVNVLTTRRLNFTNEKHEAGIGKRLSKLPY